MAMQNDDDDTIRFCTAVTMNINICLNTFSFVFFIRRAICFWKIIQDFSEWHVVGIKFSTVELTLPRQWGMQVSEINEKKKKSYEILVNKSNNKLFNLKILTFLDENVWYKRFCLSYNWTVNRNLLFFFSAN